MNLTPEQKAALHEGEAIQISLDDTECVIVRRDIYDRVKPLVTADPLSVSEQRYMLRELGRLAGWDDPEMDVYDELDPRR